MKPSIEHALTFIKVVEHQSFTAAAEALNLSKSVVSKHISALEEALNTRLFERSTRNLKITEAGQMFYDHIHEIPGQVSLAHHAIQKFNEEPGGHLKILAPTSFVSSLRINVIPDFLAKYPNVILELELLPSIEHYVPGNFDIVLIGHLSGTPMPDYNLIAVKICEVPLGMYATPNYLKQHGTPKTPNDLKDHNCISSQSSEWPFKGKEGYIYKIPVHGNLLTKNDEVVKAVALKDIGIAYSFPYLFMEELKQKKVVSLLNEYTDMTVEIYALYHLNPYLPKKIQAFIEATKAYYQSMQKEILARRHY